MYRQTENVLDSLTQVDKLREQFALVVSHVMSPSLSSTADTNPPDTSAIVSPAHHIILCIETEEALRHFPVSFVFHSPAAAICSNHILSLLNFQGCVLQSLYSSVYQLCVFICITEAAWG